MPKYIECDKLMKIPIRINHYDKERGNEQFVLGIEFVLEYADYLPAADVAPVRHGRWERAFNLKPSCSECGEYHLYSWSDYKNCKYCPNCGAKMELPEPYNPSIPRDQWEDHARFE